MTPELLVAADDRSGALEVAAGIADAVGPVPVVPWVGATSDTEWGGFDATAVVVDLGSRHLDPATAAGRAVEVGARRSGRHAHKIDSTLRGNWSHELVARARLAPVLLVPSLPEFGRSCRGGTVFDGDRPVAEGPAGSDIRNGPVSSRPADALGLAGADEVVALPDIAAVRAWCEHPFGIAVADASTDGDLDRIVGQWSSSAGVVLAGTSAVISRAPVRSAIAESSSDRSAGFRRPQGGVLVVCGSVHPAARQQVSAIARRGIPVTEVVDASAIAAYERTGVLVVTTRVPVGAVTPAMADEAASMLARGVGELLTRVGTGTLVLIGGDTAASVLGPVPVMVHGTAGPGTARAIVEGPTGDAMLVITRAGGFGDESSLDTLLRSTLAP